MGPLEPHEGGVGIAVDNVIALGFNQRFGLAHNRVTAHGNGRGQARIEKAAGVAPVPDLPDNHRQAVLISREARAEKAFGAVSVIGLRQTFNQPHRVDQEGADNRRVQAFVVQHQHRVVQTGA